MRARVLKKIPENKRRKPSHKLGEGARRACEVCKIRLATTAERQAVGNHRALLRAIELPAFLCHFWWQKWRKSHARHLWREGGAQSLKQTLSRAKHLPSLFLNTFALRPRHDLTRRSLLRRRCKVRVQGTPWRAWVLKKIPENNVGRR